MFPRAIFLDLDDTIVDDSSLVESGWQVAIEESFAADDALRVAAAVYEVRDWYWSDPERHRTGRADLRAISTWIVDEALRRLGKPQAEVARTVAHRYRDIRDEGIALLPGAIDAIEGLRQRGVRLALLTNGAASAQRAKIDRFDLARHFDHVCVEGEFGCGKPDERVYQAALAALESAPDETWMAGDNLEWDVAAPMRLGITGIWLDRHAKGLPESTPVQPHRIILALPELLEAEP